MKKIYSKRRPKTVSVLSDERNRGCWSQSNEIGRVEFPRVSHRGVGMVK